MVFGTAWDESDVKIIFYVTVRSATMIDALQAEATETSSSIYSIKCVDDCNSDVVAYGYSGTEYAFHMIGNSVTLEKGRGAKNGMYNVYAYLFRSELINMKAIRASFSEEQRQALVQLRVRNFFDLVGIFNPTSVNETAKNMAKQFL